MVRMLPELPLGALHPREQRLAVHHPPCSLMRGARLHPSLAASQGIPCQPWTIPRPWRRSPSSPRRARSRSWGRGARGRSGGSQHQREHPVAPDSTRDSASLGAGASASSRRHAGPSGRLVRASRFASTLSADGRGRERERLGQRAEDAKKKGVPRGRIHVDVTRWSRHAEKQRRDRPGNRARGSSRRGSSGFRATARCARTVGREQTGRRGEKRASVAVGDVALLAFRGFRPRQPTPSHGVGVPGNRGGGFVRAGGRAASAPAAFCTSVGATSATAVATVAPVTVTSGDTMPNAVLSAFSLSVDCEKRPELGGRSRALACAGEARETRACGSPTRESRTECSVRRVPCVRARAFVCASSPEAPKGTCTTSGTARKSMTRQKARDFGRFLGSFLGSRGRVLLQSSLRAVANQEMGADSLSSKGRRRLALD